MVDTLGGGGVAASTDEMECHVHAVVDADSETDVLGVLVAGQDLSFRSGPAVGKFCDPVVGLLIARLVYNGDVLDMVRVVFRVELMRRDEAISEWGVP